MSVLIRLGTKPQPFIRIGGHSAVAALILLLSSAALAYPFSLVAGVPFHVALLAVAPGGVAEIAILATILGVDPVFVTFHQVFLKYCSECCCTFGFPPKR